MIGKLGVLVDLLSTALFVSFVSTTIVNDKVDFIEVAKVSNRVNETSMYADIINYANKPTLEIRNRMTCAHETTHMINAELRNKATRVRLDDKLSMNGRHVNAFYLPAGWGFVVEEPNIRKIQVADFIPPNVRGYRYNTYITGARAWDKQPLYIVDEWCAYINGALVGIDDVNNGRYRDGWTDGVSGCLEFSLYGVALCMAIEKYDNKYWNENKRFKAFMKWNLKRAYNTYEVGKDYKEFKWNKQEEFLQRFRTSEETKAMRDFITEHFDGIGL